MLRLAAVLLAFATAAFAQERDASFLERARKEGAVSLYTSMQLVDSRPLTEAFEKKYGIKVQLWRASGEKIVQRVVTEARGGRFDVDVVETDGAQMEILHREKQLARLQTPSARDIPASIIPAHGSYIPTRLTLYVLAYNTTRVPPAEAPKSYQDLLQPRWAGRFAVEAADVQWLAAVAKSMGEAEGIAFFRKLGAMKPGVRSGHTLMSELVAAGEIDMAVDAHVQGVARLKDKGAPIDWRPLQPAFGQPSSVGVAARAPHPTAALLFADFILSKEGQEIIKSRNRVPSSTAVDSPLNKFPYRLIDPAIMLDEWDKWSALWSEIFLGGKPVAKE
ncbi:MAG TPA: extracellular solute-binding protein [Usitatibacter sp.]|nr:extracellular solute-binding protein [Usitatibacter sp.]